MSTTFVTIMQVQIDPGATAEQSGRIYAEDTLGVEEAAGLEVEFVGPDEEGDDDTVLIRYTGPESLIEKLLLAAGFDADEPDSMRLA